MALNLFGYALVKSKEEDEKNRPTFIPPAPEGSLVVAEGSFYGQAFDLNNGITNEADLIAKYREMAEYPDVDYAIAWVPKVLGSIEAQHRRTVWLDFPDDLANLAPYGRAEALFAPAGVVGGAFVG